MKKWLSRAFSLSWKMGSRGQQERRGVRAAHLFWAWAALLVALTGLVAVTPALGQEAENGVCGRTQQVRDAIVASSGASDCGQVTESQLGDITALNLSNQGIDSLGADDFDGLRSLRTLDLSDNLLEDLPNGLFDELVLLKSLSLHGNRLESIPQDIFKELFLLEELTLNGNSFTSLPSDLFDELSQFDGMQANGAPPDNSGSYPRIQLFLDRHGPESPEEFIAALPPLYKERFAMMYESGSPAAEHVSAEHPRVISWGADAEFIFAWNTDPDAPEEFRQPIEFLRQNDDDWTAGVIDFSGESPAISEPASCQTCHSSLGKPLWGMWNKWAGSEFAYENTAESYGEVTRLVLSQLGFGICLRKGPIELSCLVGSVDGGGGSDGQGQIRGAAGTGTAG